MQKRLFIIRHAKSSWESEVKDADRPLIERGVNDSYAIAGFLAKANLIPERIYSSPGIRALHTAVIMARVWELPDDAVSIRGSLYMAGFQDIEELLMEVSEEVNSLAIFGHNPTVTEYANQFLSSTLDNLSTAGVVVLTFEVNSWTEIHKGKIVDELVKLPKSLI